LLRNAKKRDKKIEQNNRGKRKKTEGKKATLFVMSVFVFFLTPLVTKRPKVRLEKSRKNKNKNKIK
jgi:hypothetical protein